MNLEAQMNTILYFFFEHLGTIMMLVFLLMFATPFIRKSKKKNRKEGKVVLTPKTIVSESGLSYQLPVIIFLGIFLLSGIMIIFTGISMSSNVTNKIFTIIFGSIFVLIPLLIIENILKKNIQILTGNYVVLKDVLKDKDYYISSGDDKDEYYYLFFENYFERFDKKLSVGKSVYQEANIGDEFYLVFAKKSVYAFNARYYDFNDYSKSIHIEELDEYLNVKEFELEKNTEIIHINKKRITDDFLDDGERKTCIIFLLSSLFVIAIAVGAIMLDTGWVANLIVVLFAAAWIFLAAVKIKYVIGIVWNIKKGNFRIKRDRVVSLNDNIDYKDSNMMTSFKFENYKKIVYAKKKDYNDVAVGDDFYLVFVKGEEEPVRAYHCKQSVLELMEK